MKLKIKKLDPSAVIPSYAKAGDACFDLTAISIELTNEYIQYGTGLAVEIPDGYVGLLLSRSSVTKKDLMLKNSVGIIDSGYRGELCLRFHLTEGIESNRYTIGDRIGQMMILPIPKVEFIEVDELLDSDRGTGGYGSTGN